MCYAVGFHCDTAQWGTKAALASHTMTVFVLWRFVRSIEGNNTIRRTMLTTTTSPAYSGGRPLKKFILRKLQSISLRRSKGLKGQRERFLLCILIFT